MMACNEFQREASQGRSTLVGELFIFLANNKKWWLLPIILGLLLVALLMVFAGTGAAPFVYTIF